MERGYIKLWRKTLDSGLLQHDYAFKLFAYLLLQAAWKPRSYMAGNMKIELTQGQCVVGRHKLAEALGLTEAKIRAGMDFLENGEYIASKPTNKYSLITVINWAVYQVENEESTSTLTNKSPTNHQQIATTKELEEGKKEKKERTFVAYGSDFEEFWKAYPVKNGKADAWKQWEIHKPPLAAVLQALSWQKNTKRWKDGFVKDPERYIKGHKWEDAPAYGEGPKQWTEAEIAASRKLIQEMA